jgi:hypothetical protein
MYGILHGPNLGGVSHEFNFGMHEGNYIRTGHGNLVYLDTARNDQGIYCQGSASPTSPCSKTSAGSTTVCRLTWISARAGSHWGCPTRFKDAVERRYTGGSATNPLNSPSTSDLTADRRNFVAHRVFLARDFSGVARNLSSPLPPVLRTDDVYARRSNDQR